MFFLQVQCWNPLSTRAPRSDSTWVSYPPMTVARYRPGSVVMDGKLYVAGGYEPLSHKFLSSVEVFDDVSQMWYKLPSMSQGRAGLGLAAVEGKLYAVGGWRDHQYLNSVEMYDPLSRGWEEVASLQVRISPCLHILLIPLKCRRCGGSFHLYHPGEIFMLLAV